jgi:hypothetical protein
VQVVWNHREAIEPTYDLTNWASTVTKDGGSR